MKKTPITGYSYSRLGVAKRAPLIPNDWPEIYGRSWGKRAQPATNPGDPLSGPLARLRMPRFWGRYSRSDIGLGMTPIMGYLYSRLGGREGHLYFPTIGAIFPGNHDKIVANRPPTRGALLLDPKRGYACLIFGAILDSPIPWWKRLLK